MNRVQHASGAPLPVLIAVVLCLLAPRAAEAAPCRSETFEDAGYTVCSFDLTKADLRLFWRKPDGAPYATFSALADQLAGQGRSLQFAMNGGMYGDDLSPDRPLRRERGRDARGQHRHGRRASRGKSRISTRSRTAYFIVHGDEAGVTSTDAFVSERPAADFATQSGPMLVIDGAIHPAFIVDSTDRKQRNGVGVTSPTKVHFVITEGRGEFLRFRPLLPRQARLPQRAVPGRRLGARPLCPGDWAATTRPATAATGRSSRSWSKAQRSGGLGPRVEIDTEPRPELRPALRGHRYRPAVSAAFDPAMVDAVAGERCAHEPADMEAALCPVETGPAEGAARSAGAEVDAESR